MMGYTSWAGNEPRPTQGEKEMDREEIEKEYGKAWDTNQLQEDFTVKGFQAPYVVVTRKADNKTGSLEFQHMPRFYYNFKEA